ncbi:thrombospondin type 3 repeat-containing protein [Pseudothermotoga sp.]|uniref:thrombospondin type 3 repeat-containing protein n=1 Tax=Pseudothermotoga sp. TaxID=2033661 RepID=UPI0031F6F22E
MKKLYPLMICLTSMITVFSYQGSALSNFIQFKTYGDGITDFLIDKNVVVLVLTDQEVHKVQVYNKTDKKLLWEKKYKSILTNIWKARIVDEKLCLFVEESSSSVSSPRLAVLDLRTGKDLSTDLQRAIAKFGTIYPFQMYKTQLLFKSASEFYVFDLKQEKLTHPEGNFIALVGDKILYFGKADPKAKNEVPLLFCLEDGKIQWKDKKFGDEEIKFLRDENLYLQDITVEGFPIFFAKSPKLKQGSTRFLVLTELGTCKFYEPRDLGLESTHWKVLFQHVKSSGKNTSLVVGLTIESDDLITDLILLTFNMSGDLIAKHKLSNVQILHHELDGSGRLILICQGYTDQSFIVFDATSLNKLLDRKLPKDLSIHQVLVNDREEIYMKGAYEHGPCVFSLSKSQGELLAFYAIETSSVGFIHFGACDAEDLFLLFKELSQPGAITVARIPKTNKGWLEASLSVEKPTYAGARVKIEYTPNFAKVSANAGFIEDSYWLTPAKAGVYTLTLQVGSVKKEFPVNVEELEVELNLPELIYTDSQVEISYSPAQAILSTSSGRLEKNDWYVPTKPGQVGYIWHTPSEPGLHKLFVQLQDTKREFVVNVLPKDSDGDGLTDWLENLFGSDPNNANTDADAARDNEDLSVLLNPPEPVWKELQEPGMIRLEQAVCFFGLDGWVEKYLHSKLIERYEEQGTRKSKMNEETYRKIIDELFKDEHFTTYRMDKTSRYQNTYGLEQDHKPEFSCIFPSDVLHPMEFRFYYDWLTDFRIVHLKNKDAIHYPSQSSFYRYLMYPVRFAQGYETNILIQFFDYSTYDSLSYENDSRYKIAGFLFSFYTSSDFNKDDNVPLHEGIAVAMIEKPGLFRAVVRLPKEKAKGSSAYLKLTPIWIEREGKSVSYKPLMLKWDVTGLVRETTFLKDAFGNGKVLCEELASFEDLNSEISWSFVLNKPTTTATNIKINSQQLGIVQKNDQQESRYTVIDLVQNVTRYAIKGLELSKKVCSFTETSVKSIKRVDDLEKLPNDHWARSKKFGVAKSSLEVATGIASMITDGNQAWVAFKQGDYIQASYFALKTISTAVSATPELVNIAKDVFGYSGKATKLAVLSSKKVQVGVAIAVGVVEFGYDSYKFITVDDPIMKQAYGEKMAADVLDTGVSIVAVFFPHVLAGQITWSVGVEVYSWFFGEDLAYRVCRTPGSAAAFLWEYFVGDIPAELAKEAYIDALSSLFKLIENLNNVYATDKTFYLSVFVDPQK